VFESIEDFKARIDDPDLDIDETSILVLKGCGPKGYPGMPEVGNMPLPRKLLARGVRDMVRISDARMSGTAFGTVILHVAPEAEAGGPLAIVQTGDEICSTVPRASSNCLISDEEIEARLADGAPRARRRNISAAITNFISTTCCRPTAAAISISSSAPAARTSSGSRTDGAARRSSPVTGEPAISGSISATNTARCLQTRADPGQCRTGDVGETFLFSRARMGHAHGVVPAVLCGMVGSTIGWRNVPYIACPMHPDAIVRLR
jgi:hypothetical protein